MPTAAKYENGKLTYFDDVTQETIDIVKAISFKDDFLGFDFLDTETGSKGIWETVEVALNQAIRIDPDEQNGAVELPLDADSNAEDAVLYFGDQRPFNVDQGCIFEARINMSVLATTGVSVVMGMIGDHNLDNDTVTEAAWFRMDASGVLKVETDDTTNNNDDIATGITLVAGTYAILKIDFTDLSDVRFFVDGASVATGTTFDMSNLSAAEAKMQPYFSLDKASGTGVGTLVIDYVKVWQDRS